MRRLTHILLVVGLVSISVSAIAKEYEENAVWQGWNLKLDLANSVFEPARSRGKIQSYEGAVSFDLLHRYYPTLDFGYAQADLSAASGAFSGKGGFMRVGMDLSALKKRRSMNMLLVGLRVGTAVQGCSSNGIRIGNDYWGYRTIDFKGRARADAWGEVLAGVQVQVHKNFHMGWYVRYKILMTRGSLGTVTAYYIPGYGYKQDTNFSFNYYIGWKM